MSDATPSGFLRRWSRLKQEEHSPSDDAAQVSAEAVGEAAGAEVLPVAQDAAEEVPALTDADMPPIESLNADSDYSQFMGQGISDALRRRALRKLFALPEFNIRDGLNDYDDDFTQFVPLGDTITYQMKQWLQQAQEQQAGLPQGEVAASTENQDVLHSGSEARRTDLVPSKTVNERVAVAAVEPPIDDADHDELGEADG